MITGQSFSNLSLMRLRKEFLIGCRPGLSDNKTNSAQAEAGAGADLGNAKGFICWISYLGSENSETIRFMPNRLESWWPTLYNYAFITLG